VTRAIEPGAGQNRMHVASGEAYELSERLASAGEISGREAAEWKGHELMTTFPGHFAVQWPRACQDAIDYCKRDGSEIATVHLWRFPRAEFAMNFGEKNDSRPL
jgi:hypothetical protein